MEIVCSYHRANFVKFFLIFLKEKEEKYEKVDKKFLIIFLLFGITYIILFNIIIIDENVDVPRNAIVITTANKTLAIGSLSVIVVSIILEIYMLIKYINKTISPDSFKINLIKLVIFTVALIIICALCYYIYVVTSNTRFYLNT